MSDFNGSDCSRPGWSWDVESFKPSHCVFTLESNINVCLYLVSLCVCVFWKELDWSGCGCWYSAPFPTDVWYIFSYATFKRLLGCRLFVVFKFHVVLSDQNVRCHCIVTHLYVKRKHLLPQYLVYKKKGKRKSAPSLYSACGGGVVLSVYRVSVALFLRCPGQLQGENAKNIC